MALPFFQYFTHANAEQNEYASSAWPGLTISAHKRHIRASIPNPVNAISSAVYGGGMIELDRIFNIYVDRHYRCDDPPRDIADLLRGWEERTTACAGLLTAVKLAHTSVQEYVGEEAGILCCTTAGVSNAARAGSARTVFGAAGNITSSEGIAAESPYTPGTINIMLWINGRMTPGAMVNAIQTAVEAKTAALSDCGVMDAENGLTATGTTTDAIVLATSQVEGKPLISYAGTATAIGAGIGRVVYDAVIESLQAGQAWKERNSKR